MTHASNFAFLQEHDPVFLQLATTAEQVFASDPNTTLIKLRQLGEALAQDLAARAGIEVSEQTSQLELLSRLERDLRLDPTIRSLFHTLRVEGNRATHQFQTRHKEAMDGLKVARALAVWYHQSFGKQGAAFKPGAFVPPTDPSDQLRQLQLHIEQLKAELGDTQQALTSSKELAELVAREKEEYAVLAEQMDAEARGFKSQAQQNESALAQAQQQFEARLHALQARLDEAERQQTRSRTQQASSHLVLDEELTRILIDQQLQDAGWEADTQNLDYRKGARPEKGKNRAIAEWPTQGAQKADYVLFTGITPIGVVEAKRENVNVAGKIDQAERYSRGLKISEELSPAWTLAGQSGPWPDGQGGHFHVPFVYSSNGRPYLQQLAEQSGTWFRDVRAPANTKRALMDFHSPDGLLDQLKRSKEAAEAKLKQEGFAYLRLRDYQIKAIQAVESALAQNQSRCLLAMATGTGKTQTIIGLMYRFLKAERFRRILFLVDRSALGTQATDKFAEVNLEQNLPLSKLYNIAEMGDMAAEAETRIQVATVQAMVKRVFQSDLPFPVDEYDCIIVDEAHRGYTLDQEMTEGEMALRDQSQYLSSYRRVLDYFDAVKIGLTATPAKHTSEIFGKPVYTYSYREAVADDWLIDHEPPIRYQTLLTQNGITFDKGETVHAINTTTGEVETAELEDELSFEVESFNRRVINENFNRVICKALADELDPFGKEKTLIFCATDLHADMVKRLLDEAFAEKYGDQYNEAAVRKITGASDKVDQLIKRYKNEHLPSIGITVDLLTTGIDVPAICHLVFMRRVRSRILYEQMIGRATRRCDDIGKTVFKIYDPVDIYAALEDVNTMKPLVKNPDIGIDQLCGELLNPASYTVPGESKTTTHADDVLAQLSQKIMRVMRKADNRAEKNPQLRQRLGELEQLWGVPPAKLHQHLHQMGPQAAANFIRQQRQLVQQIEAVQQILGSDYRPVISEHEDELKVREQSYGKFGRPEDYLDGFSRFIKEQLNQSAALAAVVNKPRDLTRAQLKEVKLLLDGAGFTAVGLQSAWRNRTNQDIAASIIGYIRQAALGEALIPFEQRVATAMQRIYSLANWTPVQRRWLDRLAKQLVHEVVIDPAFVNEAFRGDGGVAQLDKHLGGKLDTVLSSLAESLWNQSA